MFSHQKKLYLCILKTNGRFGSSVWLECLPVTQEVASSSLVRTAKQRPSAMAAYFVISQCANGCWMVIFLI